MCAGTVPQSLKQHRHIRDADYAFIGWYSSLCAPHPCVDGLSCDSQPPYVGDTGTSCIEQMRRLRLREEVKDSSRTHHWPVEKYLSPQPSSLLLRPWFYFLTLAHGSPLPHPHQPPSPGTVRPRSGGLQTQDWPPLPCPQWWRVKPGVCQSPRGLVLQPQTP